jgi:hypothetical protein
VLKQGRVGGDSGGYFTHHWSAAPLTVKGKKVKLKGTTFMASPVNYRLRTEIAGGQRSIRQPRNRVGAAARSDRRKIK